MRFRLVAATFFALTSVAASGAPGAQASGCARSYPFNSTYARVISVATRKHLTCSQAARVGEAVTVAYVHNQIPLKSFAPPPKGVPGGKGRPFSVATPSGRFVCRMVARGSDFIDASCQNGGKFARFDGNTHQIRPGH